MKRLTRAQKELLQAMRAGRRLWWFGDNGPELERAGRPVQKRTVRALLAAGILKWEPYANETHRQCGIAELRQVGMKKYDDRLVQLPAHYDALGRPCLTRVQIICPFCEDFVEAYEWSLAGSGKRCDCGALLKRYGAYPPKKRGAAR